MKIKLDIEELEKSSKLIDRPKFYLLHPEQYKHLLETGYNKKPLEITDNYVKLPV